EAPAAAAMRFEDGVQIGRRIRVRCVDPDADVLDDRGVLRLTQIGRTSEERQRPICAEIEALEKNVAEGVIAGQVIHALLPEHQEPIQSPVAKQAARGYAPALEFFTGEMQRHRASYPSRAITERFRP